MAEKRMFLKSIINSDEFLDMPLSAQCLYFHLSMRGDDEGFVNNPRKIQRSINATQDDIKLLIAKRYILPFDTGVIVIRHWKLHNCIRRDRLTETKCVNEKKLLQIAEDGTYEFNCDSVEDSKLSALEMRKNAYSESTLPYSFEYKIKRAFSDCKCPKCGAEMNPNYNSKPSIQHNIPISKGGKHELDNISVICLSCNTSIRDNETEPFNTHNVNFVWDQITEWEKRGIDWFWNDIHLSKLRQLAENVPSSVRQVTVNCPSSDRQATAQVRLGQISTGKNSIDDRIGKIIEAWESNGYHKIVLTRPLTDQLNDVVETIPVDTIIEAIERGSKSDYLMGRQNNNPTNMRWFMRAEIISNVLEGKYDNRTKKKNQFNSADQRSYNSDELERLLLTTEAVT